MGSSIHFRRGVTKILWKEDPPNWITKYLTVEQIRKLYRKQHVSHPATVYTNTFTPLIFRYFFSCIFTKRFHFGIAYVDRESCPYMLKSLCHGRFFAPETSSDVMCGFIYPTPPPSPPPPRSKDECTWRFLTYVWSQWNISFIGALVSSKVWRKRNGVCKGSYNNKIYVQ